MVHLDYSTQVRDEAWDQFVISFAEPHHEQTSIWAELKEPFGWISWRILVLSRNQILGGVQILEYRLNRFLRVGYIQRGPLLSDPDLAPRLFEFLKVCAVRRGIDYLALSLPYFAHPLIAHAFAAGFTERPDRLPPSVWVKATLIKDLHQNEDSLFQEMRSTTKKHIRRGLRSDILVRDGTRDDIPAFVELVEKLCERRGITSNMPLGAFPQKLWDAFHSRNMLHLFIAQNEQQPVAGLIVITTGLWARAWRIGWAGDQPEKHPTMVLYWKAIQWAKNNNYAYFDFLGLDIDDAKDLLSSRDKSAPFKCGITYSKVGMGGQIHLLAGEYCYFVNPLFRHLFNCGGSQLLKTRWFVDLVNSIHGITCRVDQDR